MSIAMPAHDPHPGPHLVSVPAGRLRSTDVTSSDRNYGTILHLAPLIAVTFAGPLALVAPIVMWLLRKDESSFVDDHGRESVNFGISFMLYHVVLGITVIGVVLFPVLWIVALVNVIRAAVASSNGEFFRYPITLRFLS